MAAIWAKISCPIAVLVFVSTESGAQSYVFRNSDSERPLLPSHVKDRFEYGTT